MFKKTITSDFFTTISLRQDFHSLYLMTFWLYKLRYWKEKELFEKELLEYVTGYPQGAPLQNKKIISFYNARSALYHALKIIGLEKEDEVIVNAYTCVSVSNAVIQSGAKIKYSDIEVETLSFDYEILKKNITEKTKVIIIQHTFWMQSRDYEKVIDLAKEKDIRIIEDCALSLGNKESRGAPCGYPEILWDFAIFSLWRDKVISSVTGWFLFVNNTVGYAGLHTLPNQLHTLQESLKMPSRILTLQNLAYNIVWYKAYKLYDFLKLWKIIIFLSRKMNFITEILTLSEKNCNFKEFNLDYPNSLAYLAREELKNITLYKDERIEKSVDYICSIKNSKIQVLFMFITEDIFNGFRVPILLDLEEEAEKLYKYMRKNNILLGKTWSWTNIVPIWTDLKKAWYISGSCTIAEDISKRILFLPNHSWVNERDLEKVVELINNFK